MFEWATQSTQHVSILRVANTPLNRGILRGKCLSLQAYEISINRPFGYTW